MTVTAALAMLARSAVADPLPVLGGGRVVACDGTVIEVEGIAGAPGGRALVGSRAVPAEIIGFSGGRARLMGLERLPRIVPGTMVRLVEAVRTAGVGPALLGRVIDGNGRASDGGAALVGLPRLPLDPLPIEPFRRARVSQAMPTGVRVIDGLMTLGRGQRAGLMAGSGVGKSVLIGQIARTASADVTVVALIGERGREIADFIETELAGPARQRIVTVVVPADAPPLLRLSGARQALTIAEDVRARGGHALVILDSLTRVIHAQRDIALARGEPAGPRGLPASALALIADLVERAGGDRITGGAVTLVATVLADADNANDPIVDAARGVLDGHILLSRSLAQRGIWPAIDIGASLSRVMADITAPAHREAAARARRTAALIEENRDLVLMGAYAPGGDPELDRALAKAGALDAFRRQAREVTVPYDETLSALEGLAA